MGTTIHGTTTDILSMHTVIVAARGQVSSDLAGETVILNLKDGVYYGLDKIGARVWYIIQEPMPVYAIRDTLLGEYDVPADQCERDLLALLQSLMAASLVEVSDAPDA